MEEYRNKKEGDMKEWSPQLEEIRKLEEGVLALENRINVIGEEIESLDKKLDRIKIELEKAMAADKSEVEAEYNLYIEHLKELAEFIQSEIKEAEKLKNLFEEEKKATQNWLEELKGDERMERFYFLRKEGPSDAAH